MKSKVKALVTIYLTTTGKVDWWGSHAKWLLEMDFFFLLCYS